MGAYVWYNLHGLVGIKSNVKYLEPFLGFFKTGPLGVLKPSIRVEVKRDVGVKKEELKRISAFYHSKLIDGIYFEQPFPVPVQLLVRNIKTDEVIIEVTPFFLRLPTFLRGGINFSYLFRETLLLKLLEKNHLFLHAACVEIDNQGILLPAFPDTGKTFTSFGLVKGTCAKLLSDEYVIVNSDGKTLAFPSVTAIHPKLIKNFNVSLNTDEIIKLSVNKILARSLPFLFESIVWIPLHKITDSKRVVTETDTKFIIFLERGPTKIMEIEKEMAIKKLTIMTQHEFSLCSNPIFQVYSYVNDAFNLNAYLSREREIIGDMVRKSKKCFVASSEGKHFELLNMLLKNGFCI